MVMLDVCPLNANLTMSVDLERGWITHTHTNYKKQKIQAKSNPGYSGSSSKVHPFHPNITGFMNPGLVDFVVKERLFNFYLVNGKLSLLCSHVPRLQVCQVLSMSEVVNSMRIRARKKSANPNCCCCGGWRACGVPSDAFQRGL
jgi:hypothetical protein